VAAACAGVQESGRGAFLCFQHHTPGDVLLDTHKVLGSAQRRRAGALLQHGSVLLAASPHAPELAGLRELTGINIPPGRLAADIGRSLARQTGWTLHPVDWPPALLDRRDEIVATRYANPAWTERR
jgi:lipoate-protein ligase A